MMKDVDGLSRHIDPLIHRYLVQTYIMRAADTTQQPFAYCHDTFASCSNPRRVVASDTTVITKSSFTLPFFPIVHHSPINFISTPTLQLVPPLQPKLPLFHHNIISEGILWLFFDSITRFLGSLLSHWPAGSVRHYIFETELRHYHLSIFLSSSPPPKYATLLHLFYHLQLLKNITIDLPLPTELPIVSRLVLTHGTTLITTLGTTLALPLVLPWHYPRHYQWYYPRHSQSFFVLYFATISGYFTAFSFSLYYGHRFHISPTIIS